MAGAPRCVPVIGLIGGIGSGKSHLARELASRRRVIVVNADQIGHQLLREPEVKEEIRRVFGDDVFGPAGEIDRRVLGARVFGPHSGELRKKLDLIMHPRIGAVMAREVAQARQAPEVAAVIVDAALLLEAGWETQCDQVVFVESRFADRLDRVARTRGWSAEELKRREASQWSLEEKRNRADAVVDNSASGRGADELEELLDAWMAKASKD